MAQANGFPYAHIGRDLQDTPRYRVGPDWERSSIIRVTSDSRKNLQTVLLNKSHYFGVCGAVQHAWEARAHQPSYCRSVQDDLIIAPMLQNPIYDTGPNESPAPALSITWTGYGLNRLLDAPLLPYKMASSPM